MPPSLKLYEPAESEKARPFHRVGSSGASRSSLLPEHSIGPQAAGNQAIQRLATEGVSPLEPSHSEVFLSSETQNLSKPSESQPADELVSRPEEVTIHFDPKRPWLFSVTGTTDEMAITAELYGEGLSVPLEKRQAVGFAALVPRLEDRYVVIPWLLRPYYADLFNQAFEWRKTELDIEVKADAREIESLISKHIDMMRMFPVPPVEDRVIQIMRHWADEPFPYHISDLFQNEQSGRYLDKLLLHLSDAYVEEGLFVDTWTNYHSLILNHFRRADEVKSIQDQHARVFAGERALPEAPGFFDILWEEVKSGAVRDRIVAYGRGLAKGAYSAAKGTLEFAHTLVTDPGKAWEDLKNVPGALKSLWENRGELWQRFASASPEEQAEMIGQFIGNVEAGLATGGAGSAAVSKLAQVEGWIGKIARE